MAKYKITYTYRKEVDSLDGLYTAQEAAKDYGITTTQLKKILNQNNIEISVYQVKGIRGKARVGVLDKKAQDFISDYFFNKELENEEREAIREEKKEEIKLPKNIEELKRLHPLVKDERFFCEWYFPQVMTF